MVYIQGHLSREFEVKRVYSGSETHFTIEEQKGNAPSDDKETHAMNESFTATKSNDTVNTNSTKIEAYKCKTSERKPTTKYDFIMKSTELESIFSRSKLVRAVSCKDIFDNDGNTIVDTQIFMEKATRKGMSDARYIQMAKNCTHFILKRGYLTSSFTRTEKDFPLAFSILVYKDVEQFERLLRAIYRPQNVYCVHVDLKITEENKKAVNAIVSCFPNVFMSSRSVDVQWGEFSVLEAELICMKDLWAYDHWKYFINLTGQEFPLKTNLELVKILETMKWANVVDGTWIRANVERKGMFGILQKVENLTTSRVTDVVAGQDLPFSIRVSS